MRGGVKVPGELGGMLHNGRISGAVGDGLQRHGVEPTRPVGAQPNPHLHGRAVDGRLEHLLPGVGDAHGASALPRGEGGQGEVIVGLPLPAEAAADIAGKQAHSVRGNAEGLGQGVLAALDHLDGGMDHHLVPFPPGGGGAGLHLGVVLEGAEPGGVDRDRGGGVSRLEVTDARILLARDGSGGVDERPEVEVCIRGFVGNPDPGLGCAGVFRRIGKDEGHRLAIVLDPVGSQGWVGSPLAARIELGPPLCLDRDIEMAPDQDHAGG